MPEFRIHSFEIDSSQDVTANGIAEAMLEFLPWPSLDISIAWSPSNGVAKVIDNQTDFEYQVTVL
jgi:hypothetical protein